MKFSKLGMIVALLSGNNLFYSMQHEGKIATPFPLNPSPLLNQLIELPSEQVIKQRLIDLNLKKFVEVTQIDKQLGGQKLYPLRVFLTVHYAISDYIKKSNVPNIEHGLALSKQAIIQAILKEHPDMINEIAKAKL